MLLTISTAENETSFDRGICILLTHLLGLASYAYLGHLTHRTSWKDRHLRLPQNLLLPLAFIFFPLLQPAQILNSIIRAFHNLRSKTSRRDTMFYLYGILAMHSLLRYRPALGSLHMRILDKPQLDGIRSYKLAWTKPSIAAFCTLSVNLAFQSYAAYSYWCSLARGNLLIIEHLCGQMAAGGACASLSCLILLGFRLEWQDGQSEQERKYEGCVDTSNAFVFDIFSGILLQQWILFLAFYFGNVQEGRNNISSPILLLWATGLIISTLIEATILLALMFNSMWALRTGNSRYVPNGWRNGGIQRYFVVASVVVIIAIMAFQSI